MAVTINTVKVASFIALGILICGNLISPPMAQHVSNPAKHHQIKAVVKIKFLIVGFSIILEYTANGIFRAYPKLCPIPLKHNSLVSSR